MLRVNVHADFTKYYKRYPLPGPRFLKPENLEASINYRPLDDDVVMSGYPKTGNTWVSLIIWTILHKNEMSFPLHYYLNEKKEAKVPYIERDGVEPVKALKTPRLYRTHLPYNLMSINRKAKYIYTYRRPEDTVLSYYKFFSPVYPPEFDFDACFSQFLEGTLFYGSYFNHVLETYAHKDDGRLLMVSYEKLKANPKEEILRIAKFLGENHYESLATDLPFLNKVLECTSFDYMKNNLKISLEVLMDDDEKISLQLVRKGVVGDGKKALTEEQRKRIQGVIAAKMIGTELLNDWIN